MTQADVMPAKASESMIVLKRFLSVDLQKCSSHYTIYHLSIDDIVLGFFVCLEKLYPEWMIFLAFDIWHIGFSYPIG